MVLKHQFWGDASVAQWFRASDVAVLGAHHICGFRLHNSQNMYMDYVSTVLLLQTRNTFFLQFEQREINLATHMHFLAAGSR